MAPAEGRSISWPPHPRGLGCSMTAGQRPLAPGAVPAADLASAGTSRESGMYSDLTPFHFFTAADLIGSARKLTVYLFEWDRIYLARGLASPPSGRGEAAPRRCRRERAGFRETEAADPLGPCRITAPAEPPSAAASSPACAPLDRQAAGGWRVPAPAPIRAVRGAGRRARPALGAGKWPHRFRRISHLRMCGPGAGPGRGRSIPNYV